MTMHRVTVWGVLCSFTGPVCIRQPAKAGGSSEAMAEAADHGPSAANLSIRAR